MKFGGNLSSRAWIFFFFLLRAWTGTMDILFVYYSFIFSDPRAFDDIAFASVILRGLSSLVISPIWLLVFG